MVEEDLSCQVSKRLKAIHCLHFRDTDTKIIIKYIKLFISFSNYVPVNGFPRFGGGGGSGIPTGFGS